MEIEGDGSKTQLKEASKVVFGRGNGFDSEDRTVSRRHVSFEFKPPRVSFEVIGKNPMWLRSKESGEIRAFRRSEGGELSVGDLFCVSAKDPVWFSLRKVEENASEIGGSSSEETELGDGLELDLSSDSGNGQDIEIDVSNIDPVKEFGFLVIGHEFDSYSKGMIRDVKRWNWFLEDRREESTDDEDDTPHGKGKRPLSRKRKKKSDRDDDDDEEWTGESEEEVVLAKSRRGNAAKYSTRSKNLGKGRPKTVSGSGKGSVKKGKHPDEEEDESEEDEIDETLGGFIVRDEDEDVVEEEEGENEDGSEEEEFEEDDFED